MKLTPQNISKNSSPSNTESLGSWHTRVLFQLSTVVDILPQENAPLGKDCMRHIRKHENKTVSMVKWRELCRETSR